MILLEATRIDANQRFLFKIEVPGRAPVTVADADEAAVLLKRLGVANPESLVAHACNWGAVEIENAGDAVISPS